VSHLTPKVISQAAREKTDPQATRFDPVARKLITGGFQTDPLPEELAEFVDSLEYDEPPAAVADCTDDDPEYND
jgi:hypothetical protein